jgi:ABC-type microcin C transport system permease subunit YejB
VPFGRNRALRILGGLFVFTFGFAVAAALVVAGQQVTPPYYVAIVAGVAGLAVAGVAMARGLPPMPETPIWSRDTLGLLSEAAGLRPAPVIVTLYLLTLLGVLGNLVYPLTFGVG